MFASEEKQRGAENVAVREVHRRMTAVYGEHALSLIRVKDWHEQFREGWESLQDDEWSGQSHSIITDDLIQLVDQISRENRRVKINDISKNIDVNYGSAQTVIKENSNTET